jgi:excisionase family DNA binding protein
MPERSLFIDDAARVLGVSRRTVYYRIRDGRLRTIRTRCGSQRVLLSSLEALLCEMAERQKAARADGRQRRRPEEALQPKSLAF